MDINSSAQLKAPFDMKQIQRYFKWAIFIGSSLTAFTSIVVLGLPALPMKYLNHRIYREYIRIIESLFSSYAMVMVYIFSPTELVLSGDLDGLKIDRKIIMANHQIYPDWCYLWNLFHLNGFGGDMKVLVMQELLYIPLMGWAMYIVEFIFIKRKWALDQKSLCHHLKVTKADNLPISLLIFPEGTLNTPGNIENSKTYAKKNDIKEHPEFVILPKSTGLHQACQTLMPEIHTLIDITVGYSNIGKNEVPYDIFLIDKVFIDGLGPKQVHLHIKKHEISTIPGFIPNQL